MKQEGIFYALFLFCYPQLKGDNKTYDDYSQNLMINGTFSFYNTNGFLPADEFYTIDLYLFLSLCYFLFALYWVYQMIIYYNYIRTLSKIMTIILPICILEKMITLQIFSELNRTGQLNLAFEVINVSCNIIKNIGFRLIFFGISLGYAYRK